MGFPLGQVGRSLSGALPEARGQTSCGSPEVNIRNRILYYRFLSASVSDSSLPPAMKVPPHKSRCCERETGFSTGNLVVGPSSPLALSTSPAATSLASYNVSLGWMWLRQVSPFALFPIFSIPAKYPYGMLESPLRQAGLVQIFPPLGICSGLHKPGSCLPVSSPTVHHSRWE